MSDWKKAFATHEEKQGLSTGDWLGDKYPGVALPSSKALYQWIEIRYKNSWTIARVMDVGPWTTDDHTYVFGTARPRAETHKGEHVCIEIGGEAHKTPSNGAGIDLFPETARSLLIKLGENVQIEWRFITPGQ